MPVHRRQRALALPLCALLLLTGSHSALWASERATGTAAAPSAHNLPSLMEDAGHGDVFALERAMASIEDPQMAVARARIAASMLRAHDVRKILADVLERTDIDAGLRATAWSLVAEASFASGDFSGAASAASRWRALLGTGPEEKKEAGDASQLEALARVLSQAPAQSIESFRAMPATVRRDTVGLPRASAVINGVSQEAVFDTGANLSVVSMSTARKLGLRLLDGEASVGSSSRKDVPTRVAVADELEFAGLRLRNAAFLVLEDSQLEFPVPGGYRIDAILGFPVLRELGRFRLERAGRLVPEDRKHDAAGGQAQNLRMVGNDLFVSAIVEDVPVALHLDTGATASSLSARFARRHPRLSQGLSAKEERVAGAGGSSTRQSVMLHNALVSIDDKSHRLPTLSLETGGEAGSEPGHFGVLGGDVLNAFSYWRIDFDAMRFELGERVVSNIPETPTPAGS